MPRHLCALCGQISFKYYHEYETHRRDVHGMRSEIKPENVTGRATGTYRDGGSAPLGTIVGDAENTWLGPHLIVSSKKPDIMTMPEQVAALSQPEHPEDCGCMPLCFNKRLDRLIASQEKSLAELNKSDTLNGESN